MQALIAQCKLLVKATYICQIIFYFNGNTTAALITNKKI